LLAVGAEQIRTEGREQLFEAASVFEALAQERDQVLGDVHATATLAVGEGEQPGGMLIPAGAGGTVFTDAGFLDEGEGAFERRPEGGELVQKVLLELRKRVGFAVHAVCIIYYIHTMQAKKRKG
jgi:hypothetical protein